MVIKNENTNEVDNEIPKTTIKIESCFTVCKMGDSSKSAEIIDQ